MDTRPLAHWVNERHAVYIRQALRRGQWADELHVPGSCDLEEADPDHFAVAEDGPLTADPILAEYRFCNVFRELDRVTVWVRRNIREPYADHPDLWIMLAIARTINWPPTLEHLMNRGPERCAARPSWPNTTESMGLGHLLFRPESMGQALERWAATGAKVYTGAYMLRAESHDVPWRYWSKHRYIAEVVIGRLWEDRELWRERLEPGMTVQAFVEGIASDRRYVGWGHFMAHQVAADMRYTRYFERAHDRDTYAALGPGSRRGLNRLLGRPAKAALSQQEGLELMRELVAGQDSWRAPWVPPIDITDMQNCLCETDKYERTRLGQGRPRSRYQPWRGE